MKTQTARNLKMLGMVLFLLGLLNGFFIGVLKNPRMGLSAHLEGVMNGTFLVVAGLVWNELRLFSLVVMVYGLRGKLNPDVSLNP